MLQDTRYRREDPGYIKDVGYMKQDTGDSIEDISKMYNTGRRKIH
jgi:hypothetical protein